MIEHGTLRLNSVLKMSPHELQFCVPEAGACDGLFVMSCPATARCRTAPHCIARGARQPGHHSHARVVPRSAASSHRVKVGSWLVIVTIRDTLNSRLLDFGIANCRICLSFHHPLVKSIKLEILPDLKRMKDLKQK